MGGVSKVCGGDWPRNTTGSDNCCGLNIEGIDSRGAGTSVQPANSDAGSVRKEGTGELVAAMFSKAAFSPFEMRDVSDRGC